VTSPNTKCECQNDGEEYCPKHNKHKWPVEAKAREIAEKLLEPLLTFCIDREGELSDKECAIGYITAALQEYGEAEYHRAFDEGRKIGDAEGYARGMKEAVQECVKTHAKGYLRGVLDEQIRREESDIELSNRSYRKGIEEAAKVACDTKIWDGGVVCAQIRALLLSEGKGERHG